MARRFYAGLLARYDEADFEKSSGVEFRGSGRYKRLRIVDCPETTEEILDYIEASPEWEWEPPRGRLDRGKWVRI